MRRSATTDLAIWAVLSWAMSSSGSDAWAVDRWRIWTVPAPTAGEEPGMPLKKETAQLAELSQRVTSVAFDVESDVSLMSVDD